MDSLTELKESVVVSGITLTATPVALRQVHRAAMMAKTAILSGASMPQHFVREIRLKQFGIRPPKTLGEQSTALKCIMRWVSWEKNIGSSRWDMKIRDYGIWPKPT